MADNFGELTTSSSALRMQSLCLAALVTSGSMVIMRAPELYGGARLPCTVPLSQGTYTAASLVAEVRINYAEQLARMVSSIEEDRDVALLARICRVTRKTYYEWLGGSSIRSENVERIASLIGLLADVQTRHRDIRSFLVTPVDEKTPAQHLEEGRADIVLGLSYGVRAPLTARVTSTGRRLRSIPFLKEAATAEAILTARRVRDIADQSSAEAVAMADEMEAQPGGLSILLG